MGVPHRLPGAGWELGRSRGPPGGLCREAQAPQGQPGCSLPRDHGAPLTCPPPRRQPQGSDGVGSPARSSPTSLLHRLERALGPPGRLPRGPPPSEGEISSRVLCSDPTALRQTAPRSAPRGHGPAQLVKERGWRGPCSPTEGPRAWPTTANQGGPPSGDAQPPWSPPVSPARPPEHRGAHPHCTQLSSRRGPWPQRKAPPASHGPCVWWRSGSRPAVLSWSPPRPAPHEMNGDWVPARRWGRGRGEERRE